MGILSSLRRPVTIARNINQDRSDVAKDSSVMKEVTISDESSSSTLGTTRTPSRTMFQELPQELFTGVKPMLMLLQANANKLYFEWVGPGGGDKWQLIQPSQDIVDVSKVMLMGPILTVNDVQGQTHRVSLVSYCNMSVSGSILQFNKGMLSLSCSNSACIEDLEKLCLLSIFEYMSLHKSLTGTIISTLGLKMPDIHVVLNSAFNYKDWCEVFIEGEGWVKLWCHIDKVPKKAKNNEPKGQCMIKFYRSNKSTSSKNLVCLIPDTQHVQDIFFYHEPEPQDSSITSANSFLDNLTMIKIVGNVNFPVEGFSKRKVSVASSSSRFSPVRNNNSDEESTADDAVLESPVMSPKRRVFSPIRHKRSVSHVSSLSTSSGAYEIPNCNTSPHGLLIRPVPHDGIHHLEAMIRCIIPMFDCAHVYGRPTQFKTQRADEESLMFGLPQLPAIDYVAEEELGLLRNKSIPAMEDTATLAMATLTAFLHESWQKNPKRDVELSFRTLKNGTSQLADAPASQ